MFQLRRSVRGGMAGKDPLPTGFADRGGIGAGERRKHVLRAIRQQDLAAGLESLSSPSQTSEMIGVAQAAASNRRTLGLHPAATMSARVTFSVKRRAE